MSSFYRDHFGEPPPGTERSVARDDLLIRVAGVLKDQPPMKSLYAVSEELLGIQADILNLVQGGMQRRLVSWMMDDIGKADDLFWKHAVEIEKTLVIPPPTPELAQERAWEDEKLWQFHDQIATCRAALSQVRVTSRDHDPALKEARDGCTLLASMARRLRRKGPPALTASR